MQQEKDNKGKKFQKKNNENRKKDNTKNEIDFLAAEQFVGPSSEIKQLSGSPGYSGGARVGCCVIKKT